MKYVYDQFLIGFLFLLEIKKRLEELNLKWEDIFPEEVLNWDTELPEGELALLSTS